MWGHCMSHVGSCEETNGEVVGWYPDITIESPRDNRLYGGVRAQSEALRLLVREVKRKI